jgi:hypothetical protein
MNRTLNFELKLKNELKLTNESKLTKLILQQIENITLSELTILSCNE